MRFLSVADRELRSAARRKATYRTRWLTAILFLGLLVWLMWAFQGFTNRRAAPEIFAVYSVLTFLYCQFLGAASTADCIGSERREGTLGLLFLTNLNSAEIIAGKLCSSALASIYGLMAIFPMLALPLLMGGITFGEFARTVLALLNGILFALAAGFISSVLCKRQFIALAMAMLLTLGLGGGLMLGAAAASAYGPTRPLGYALAPLSPLYALITAGGTTLFGPSQFWQSVTIVAVMSLGGLALTMLLLSRTWRDQPKSSHRWARFTPRGGSEKIPSARRAAFRRRLLAINPFFWLAGRQRVSAPMIMLLVLIITVVASQVAAPFFGRIMWGGTASPVIGHLVSWLWAGMGIHALVLYYAAMSASQRLAEDKQTGALELILSTPMTERTLSHGLWLAFWRKMLFPGLAAVLVHAYFIWVCMVMATLDPPGQLPSGATPGEVFWAALLDKPLRGQTLDWQFGFMLRCALLSLLILMLTWPTLGWVARWLGLRMKHPGFAPMASLGLVIAPPVLLFSLACYVVDVTDLDRLPERLLVPAMMWLALAIGVTHCAALSVWAATRLRNDLRPVAMSRYQPLPVWRWRLPSRRAVLRFALGLLIFAVIIASLVTGYYVHQNRRGYRAWAAFQDSLRQSGESLNLSPLLPAPMPDTANFARSSVFEGLLARTNRDIAFLLQKLNSFDVPEHGYYGSAVMADWSHQTNVALKSFASLIGLKSLEKNTRAAANYEYGVEMPQKPPQLSASTDLNRKTDAETILKGLEPHSAAMREIGEAALRLPAFDISTNHNAYTVFHQSREPVLMLERLHFLFQVRACASLAVGKNADAAEDLQTGLRLANLARQLPDVRSMERLQILLVRSLQPLWEGLAQRSWNEPQLAAFQEQLAGFNLLADYTNAVRRVALAHIEIWRAIPDSTNSHNALPASGGYRHEPVWQFQPRGWWFENCIQLHNAGRTAIEKVDVPGGRIQQPLNWADLNGLPLDNGARELLQQSWWWGANPSSVAYAQTAMNQATIACALERFRLANGSYPESLEQLLPAFLTRLPPDAISGRPMIYEPAGGTNFILRAVGPNGINDGNKKGSDDWQWAYAKKAAGAKK